jgi:peroxiredoxin
MAEQIATGQKAPDFDLSSTEDALLMLRDEVPRTSVLLYVFVDPESDRTKADLGELSAARAGLAEKHAKVFGICPAKMPVLKALQSDLGLSFPLLRDDRDFAERYGVVAAEGDEAAPQPALCLVDCNRVVSWLANPAGSIADALSQIEPLLAAAGSPLGNYPKTVINRLVDRWVN